jgi:hypothetical protein
VGNISATTQRDEVPILDTIITKPERSSGVMSFVTFHIEGYSWTIKNFDEKANLINTTTIALDQIPKHGYKFCRKSKNKIQLEDYTRQTLVDIENQEQDAQVTLGYWRDTYYIGDQVLEKYSNAVILVHNETKTQLTINLCQPPDQIRDIYVINETTFMYTTNEYIAIHSIHDAGQCKIPFPRYDAIEGIFVTDHLILETRKAFLHVYGSTYTRIQHDYPYPRFNKRISIDNRRYLCTINENLFVYNSLTHESSPKIRMINLLQEAWMIRIDENLFLIHFEKLQGDNTQIVEVQEMNIKVKETTHWQPCRPFEVKYYVEQVVQLIAPIYKFPMAYFDVMILFNNMGTM